MPVFIASDLQGQHLKQSVKSLLIENKCDVFDMGFIGEININKIGDIIQNNPDWCAILFCQNANCVNLLLNKYSNIRSVVAIPDNDLDIWTAKRKHNANVMCFPTSSHLHSHTINIVSNFIST